MIAIPAVTPSRVLVVDADLTACSILSRTMAALGFGYDIACSAAEARRLVAAQRYRVGVFSEHLADTDADTDGVRLYQELRGSASPMAGVLMSGLANLDTVARAVGAGMTYVVRKPVDCQELIQLLSQSSGAGGSGGSGTSRGRQPETGTITHYSEKMIADLSAMAIHEQMSREELITVIRSVEYPFAGKERLEYFDRDTLERVVHLIRRWCCNRLQRPVW